MLKIQWWTLPVFDLIYKIYAIETVLETWVKGISSKGYCQLETREVSNTQLLDKGVYLQNKDKSPRSWYLPSEKKSPPLYDVGVLLGLRGILHPLVRK